MADRRKGRTTNEIDEVKSYVHHRIIDCMKHDMTKNEILNALFEEDDVQCHVTGAEWQVLEQLNRELFEKYRARILQTRPEVHTFIPTPRGSQSQLGVPVASGPQVNWQPPMPNIGALSLVQPWERQGPNDMEDPIGILERNLSYNVAIMHRVNPHQDFDFSGIYMEPTVNRSGVVGAVPEGSLSGIRADIPESSGTNIIESNPGSPSLGDAEANMQGNVQQQGEELANIEDEENNLEADAGSDYIDGNGEIINRGHVRDIRTRTRKKPKPERYRKLITSRNLNNTSYKISKPTRKKRLSNLPLKYIVKLYTASLKLQES